MILILAVWERESAMTGTGLFGFEVRKAMAVGSG